MKLVIGNKNYSSWSLRPWLALKEARVPFREVVVALDQPDTAVNLARWSPSLKVPVLHHGARVVWDSLAIVEYVNELFPDRGIWPVEPGLTGYLAFLPGPSGGALPWTDSRSGMMVPTGVLHFPAHRFLSFFAVFHGGIS
jgi:hypothetical protein